MTAKRLLLLALALLALSRSLPGQDPARPRGGGYKLVELTVPANVEVVSDIVYATYIEKWFPETIDRAANFFNSVFDLRPDEYREEK